MSVKFTCPNCGASHSRGHLVGTSDVYRCLRCGYVGDGGHHPDPEIDTGIREEIASNQAWNVAHGLPAGPAIV